MSFLLINLMVLAVVASAGVLAYAQMLQWSEADEWLAPAPGIDYAALQAHWGAMPSARDWESLQAQVRGWHETGAASDGPAHCEEVARHLNRAVFRFAVPGDALTLGPAGGPCGADMRAGAAHCSARLRSRARA